LPFSYIVYKEHRLVISTGSGLVTWSEIKARQDDTQTDPIFDPEFNQIVDLRTVTSFEMTPDETRLLARRHIFSADSKRAFIAPDPSVFGVGRMWGTFTELSDNPSEVHVFYDLASALKWLGIKDHSELL
jgi:hypothetical protein